jgi:hypothetical protein
LPDSQLIQTNSVVTAKCAIQEGRIKLNFQRARTSNGTIVKFAVHNVIDYYDLRDDVRREVNLKTLKKEEKARQLKNVSSTTLSSIGSTLENQVLPITGGLLSNLARISTQASSYIPEATVPEGYLVILQISQ